MTWCRLKRSAIITVRVLILHLDLRSSTTYAFILHVRVETLSTRPNAMSSLPSIDDAATFIPDFVKRRQPGIIRKVPPDLTSLTRWADVANLKAAASKAIVLVEPKDKKKGQHGTAIKREKMQFGDFLDRLQNDKESTLYLTTQYEEEEDDDQEEAQDYQREARACFPEPIRSMLKGNSESLPLKPDMAGSLALQQMNIWIGRSSSGSSSGLHHDYHDNLYILLAGRKRFILYPPTAGKHLSPHGTIHKTHPNGLIVYSDYQDVGEDGLDPVDMANWKMQAIEQEMEACQKKIKKGKKELAKRLKRLEKEYEEAVEVQMDLMMENGEGDDDLDLDGMDDFDLLETAPTKRNHASTANDSPGAKRAKVDTDDARREPDSFSKISSAQLHAHLGLPPLSHSFHPEPPGIPPKRKAKLEKAGKPIIVELSAGEMLYLPASWWHEVTSYGSNTGKGETHIAFNYWFHPPSDLDATSDDLYKDKRVWKFVEAEVSRAYRDLVGGEDSGGSKRGSRV